MSPISRDLLNQAVKDIVKSENLGDALFAFVGRHHIACAAIAVAAFESVSALLKVDFDWTLYQVAQSYRSIRDATTAFLVAARAERLEPTYDSWHLYHIMFHHHVSRGRDADAHTVLRRNAAKSPENVILSAAQVEAFLSRTDEKLLELPDMPTGDASSDAVTSTLLIEPSELVIPPIRVFGPDPLALSFISPRMRRAAITMFEIRNATVIIG